ncbi:MAG: FkbM family methyltransferase [Oceanicoccus sp.]|jgi:FkbM family methyltransferase
MGLRTLYYQVTGIERWRNVVRKGINYRARYLDNHGRNILKHGIFEPRQTGYLTKLALANKFDGFVDIGSCFGYYVAWLIKHAAISESWAFEASPETYLRLVDHIQRNHLQDKVTLYNFALSEQEGELHFQQMDETHPGASKVVDAALSADSSANIITVPSKPVDSVLGLRDKTLIMKMDVEGHELFALQGAKQLLRGNRFLIQIESFQKNVAPVRELLEGLGYRYLNTIKDDHYFCNFELQQ